MTRRRILGRRRRNPREVERAARHALNLLPPNGNLETFLGSLGRERDRGIVIVRQPLPTGGPSGVWLATETADYIVIPADATPTREAAIVCHEVGHIMLGHSGPADQQAKIYAPDIDPAIAARFMTRHGYEAQEERDAETFGTILATEANRRRSGGSDDFVSERVR